jgi:hypothetical protein
MAFIFSDLVVFPVLRIQAKYYGWKMAFYIMGVFLVVLIGAALAMHYGLALFSLLPEKGVAKSVTERDFFQVDYTMFLNALFLGLSLTFFKLKKKMAMSMMGDRATEKVLFWVALLALAWLAGGLLVHLFL